MGKISFKISIKINRCSKGAVVPVHDMKAYGLELDGVSGRQHGQSLYPWERSMLPSE